MKYSLSEIDRLRFGVITAKLNIEAGDDVASLFASAKKNQVELMIIRVLADNLTVVQELEKEGAFLTDTLVYYRKNDMEQCPESLPQGYMARIATSTDASKLEVVALATFAGYFGHYHSDSRLNKRDCDLVYSSWAASSCTSKSVADAVLLIEKNDVIAAFATIKVTSQNEIEGVLFGVAPEHRGKGLHFSLMTLSQNWAVTNKYKNIITSTQLINTAVQKNWCRLGFEPDKSYYTFHKWFS